MTEADRLRYLRPALLLFGLVFIFGIYPLSIVWPSGWCWSPGRSDYFEMILGFYATLGVFLIIASRAPLQNLSIIWFTVWSSLVHAGIMATQSILQPQFIGHLWGDVTALFAVAVVLAFLTPRKSKAGS